jgi:hypothetical protein
MLDPILGTHLFWTVFDFVEYSLLHMSGAMGHMDCGIEIFNSCKFSSFNDSNDDDILPPDIIEEEVRGKGERGMGGI